MIEQTKPQVLSIRMVPAGVDLVLLALSKLPHEQVADLHAEIRGQALFQIQMAATPDAAPE